MTMDSCRWLGNCLDNHNGCLLHNEKSWIVTQNEMMNMIKNIMSIIVFTPWWWSFIYLQKNKHYYNSYFLWLGFLVKIPKMTGIKKSPCQYGQVNLDLLVWLGNHRTMSFWLASWLTKWLIIWLVYNGPFDWSNLYRN
jgi:hypothetical protein